MDHWCGIVLLEAEHFPCGDARVAFITNVKANSECAGL